MVWILMKRCVYKIMIKPQTKQWVYRPAWENSGSTGQLEKTVGLSQLQKTVGLQASFRKQWVNRPAWANSGSTGQFENFLISGNQAYLLYLSSNRIRPTRCCNATRRWSTVARRPGVREDGRLSPGGLAYAKMVDCRPAAWRTRR